MLVTDLHDRHLQQKKERRLVGLVNEVSFKRCDLRSHEQSRSVRRLNRRAHSSPQATVVAKRENSISITDDQNETKISHQRRKEANERRYDNDRRIHTLCSNIFNYHHRHKRQQNLR